MEMSRRMVKVDQRPEKMVGGGSKIRIVSSWGIRVISFINLFFFLFTVKSLFHSPGFSQSFEKSKLANTLI